MNKSILFVILAVVVIGGGYFLFRNHTNTPVNTYTPAAIPTAQTFDAKNSTFTVEGKSVELVNGVSEVTSINSNKTRTQYFGNSATGDFNNDGLSDQAFLITQNSGGSGTFYYVVASLQTSSGYTGTNALFLGDRIAPQTTEIRNGEIIVNYADRKASDPMTTHPTVGVSKYFKVQNNTLVASTNP